MRIEDQPRAFLLGIKTPEISEDLLFYSLEELGMLADTAGIEVISTFYQTRPKPHNGTYIGKGKLEEIKDAVKETKDISLLIIDGELKPSQQKNMEKYIRSETKNDKFKVIDRTEVILLIFAQRAQTKEAQLQVELAALKYELPRLTRMWTHLNRQMGHMGTRGGPGETQIEVDRRLLRDKISQLNKKIEQIKLQREVHRKKRKNSSVPIGAIIGYTNAGKSTLINKMTDAGVLAEDKLFATLDTTTRKLILPGNQEMLLVDTVGFINKLPHTLVNAFRATLEEVIEADFFIHVVDISAPDPKYNIHSVYNVLEELKAQNKPVITLFNKIDKEHDKKLLDEMRKEYSPSAAISVKQNINMDDVLYLIDEQLSKYRKTHMVLIPFNKMNIVDRLHQIATIITEEYQEKGIKMELEISKEEAYLINDFIINEDQNNE